MDISTLTITLNRNTATVTSTYDPDTSTFTFSSDGLINEYTLTIYNNDNPSVDVPILYTQKITFTNISLTTTPFFSYIESNNEGTFQLSTSCDLGKNHIILFSALCIGSNSDKTAAAGNTFTIKAVGNIDLGKILNELYNNNGKKVFYSDQKGNGQYKITVFPLDYVAKN